MRPKDKKVKSNIWLQAMAKHTGRFDFPYN